MKKIKPNYVETIDPDEITLHARGKTGSKRLERFSSKQRLYRVGDNFMFAGRMYLIEMISRP